MSYNSLIYLKGVQKPLSTSKANAEAVAELFHNKNAAPDFPIRIGSQSFTKSQVKLIEIHPDINQLEKNNDGASKEYDAYARHRLELLRKGPTYLSNQLEMFEYLFKLTAGREPTPEECTLAQQIQLKFFHENPRRVMCDPNLFRILMPKRDVKLNIYEGAYFKIVERAIHRDMVLSEGSYKDEKN